MHSTRYLLTLLTVFIFLTGFAQTQYEMNKMAIGSFEQADKELNDVFKEILTVYESDTVFIKNLKASQRIWITFRDAELKMKFPERPDNFYGSIHPVCITGYLEKLTRARIENLRAWLDGFVEGDACNGSVKPKE